MTSPARSTKRHHHSHSSGNDSDMLSDHLYDYVYEKWNAIQRYILIIKMLYVGVQAYQKKARQIKQVIREHPLPVIAVSTVIGFLVVRRLFK